MGVTGIGGIFFRARDPANLTLWYQTYLGVGAAANDDGTANNRVQDKGDDANPADWLWHTAAGPVVFAPFPADSDYFAADRQWMVNFRVDALDPLLETLRAAGIAITTRAEWDTPETGRFARIHDPEGNAIELWEPPAERAL